MNYTEDLEKIIDDFQKQLYADLLPILIEFVRCFSFLEDEYKKEFGECCPYSNDLSILEIKNLNFDEEK